MHTCVCVCVQTVSIVRSVCAHVCSDKAGRLWPMLGTEVSATQDSWALMELWECELAFSQELSNGVAQLLLSTSAPVKRERGMQQSRGKCGQGKPRNVEA